MWREEEMGEGEEKEDTWRGKRGPGVREGTRPGGRDFAFQILFDVTSEMENPRVKLQDYEGSFTAGDVTLSQILQAELARVNTSQ